MTAGTIRAQLSRMLPVTMDVSKVEVPWHN